MLSQKILVCEDDHKVCDLLKEVLVKRMGLTVDITEFGTEAFKLFKKNSYDMVLLDVELPDCKGTEILEKILDYDSSGLIIMMTAYSSENIVLESLRKGAYNYIKKPFDLKFLSSSVEEALIEGNKRKGHIKISDAKKAEFEKIQQSAKEILQTKKNIVPKSDIMKEFYNSLERVARKNISVLIRGESGTGKEYFSKYLYDENLSFYKKFISVNCPAIPENLAESELFGHEKGAFTGAIETKKGKIELSDKGILFLDEIADLSLEIQAKLLRVLQERELERIGSNKKIKFKTQLISATSKDLKKLIKDGLFREDLFYRIADVELYIPPLRERREDIPGLINLFSRQYLEENGESEDRHLSLELVQELCSYDWPGNIRELRSFVRRVLIFSDEVEVTKNSIPQNIFEKFQTIESINNQERSSFESSLRINDSEKILIERSLIKNSYNMTLTAKEVGISRSTLYRKIKKYQISTPNS